MKIKSKVYSNKEIGVALNNALQAAFGSVALKGLTEGRKRQLRSYTAAIVDGVLEHRKENLIGAEEIVVALTSAAMFTHVLLVAKGTENKLPMYQDQAARLAEDLDDKKT